MNKIRTGNNLQELTVYLASWRETLAAPLGFFFFLTSLGCARMFFLGYGEDGTPRSIPSWLEALLLVLSYSQILPNYWIKYQQKQWLILTDTAGQIPRFFYSLLTLSFVCNQVAIHITPLCCCLLIFISWLKAVLQHF